MTKFKLSWDNQIKSTIYNKNYQKLKQSLKNSEKDVILLELLELELSWHSQARGLANWNGRVVMMCKSVAYQSTSAVRGATTS